MSGFEISKKLKLRENAINNIGQTDYPHLDKRHFKYYSADTIAFANLTNTSMYGMLLSSCIKNYYSVAMEYYGRKIIYLELINNVDNYANTFEILGIEKGEIVTIISENLPEVFYSIYALNKIGAIVNIINPNDSLVSVSSSLNETNSKKIIILDTLCSKFENLIKDKEVYTISILDSLPFGLNYLKTAKELINSRKDRIRENKNNENYMSLNELISYNKIFEEDANIYDVLSSQETKGKDDALIIKTFEGNNIVLTNENINSVAFDYKYSNHKLKVGDSFLTTSSCYLVDGITKGMHMPFVLGLNNIMSKIKKEKFGSLVAKYSPNHLFGNISDYSNLMESSKNLSFIETATLSENLTDDKLKIEIDEFFKDNNSNAKLNVEYSKAENSGVGTSQLYYDDDKDKLTMAGVPEIYTDVRIINPETKEYLKTNEVGEIVLSGKSLMKEYFHNSKLTNKKIFETEEGRFLHTDDYGYINENGCLCLKKLFTDNLDKIIETDDGHKIIPLIVEQLILRHNSVEDCVCVGLRDNNNSTFKYPVVFVKIKEEYEDSVEQIIEELKCLAENYLEERDVPLNYIVLPKIPMINNEFVDYEYLRNNYTYNVNIKRRTK